MLVEKGETDLPSSWMLLIPLVNVFVMWKMFQSLEKLSKGKLNAMMMIVLVFLFAPAAVIIIHDWVLKSE